MGRLLRWGILIWVAVMLSVTATLFIGRAAARPADAVLESGCETPCWGGIVPGQTTFEEIETLIPTRGPFLRFPIYSVITRFRTVDRELCWDIRATRVWKGCAQRETRQDSGPITHIQLNPPAGALTLGDAVIHYGRPVGAFVCVRFSGRVRLHLTADVYFPGNVQVRVYNPPAQRQLRIGPEMVVSLVRYHRLTDTPPYRFDLPTWRGFQGLQNNIGC